MNGRLHCGKGHTSREILMLKTGLFVGQKLVWLRSVGDREELSTGHQYFKTKLSSSAQRQIIKGCSDFIPLQQL